MRSNLVTALLLLMLANTYAHAMEMKTCDDQLILSGAVEKGDADKVQASLSKNETIKTVVLRNSNGGHAETGYDIGELLRKNHINTYLSGYCMSSCSRMFLGGKGRFFTNDYAPNNTYVAFHSNYRSDGRIAPGAPWRLQRFIKKYSDEKANEALVDRWVNIPNRQGFAYFYFPNAFNRTDEISILMCVGTEPRNEKWKHCEKIAGHDALSMGIITALDQKRSCDADDLTKSSHEKSTATPPAKPD